jgi:hypothetical protein
MQYPFLVALEADAVTYRHLVWANDSGQAVRRANREYEEDPARAGRSPGTLGRIMNLTPEKNGEEFLPRIDGKVLQLPARPSEAQAVSSAVDFVLASLR